METRSHSISERTGPLAGIRVVELSAMGPLPFCGQLLSDMGADVIRIDRPQATWAAEGGEDPSNINARGRRSVAVDLKQHHGVELVLDLVTRADALIEGYRPGVLERLGLGPEQCLEVNPRLVYGRCSGWGSTGPLARAAGHDLGYVAAAGILSLVGTPGEPPPSLLGLTGDHGGGGMLLTVGVLAALMEAARSHQGQVVEASILDGAVCLTTPYHQLLAAEGGHRQRIPMLDGSAPFYSCYATADGKFVAVSAVEPKFYGQLVGVLGLDPAALPAQDDEAAWPAVKAQFAQIFRTRDRDEWCALGDGADACIAPVLTLAEAPRHPHHIARGTFVEIDGGIEPSPVPTFSRTSLSVPTPRPKRGEHSRSALEDWGIAPQHVEDLVAGGVVIEYRAEHQSSAK